MSDELVLRHVDEKRRIRVYAPLDCAFPEQYIFIVCTTFLGRVFQKGESVDQHKMYSRVLEGIDQARAKVRQYPRYPRDVIPDAVVIAWSGDMKTETLRRLAAAEYGASRLEAWAITRAVQGKLTLQEALIDSLYREADPQSGADHMTRVRALLKLADIFQLDKMPEPFREKDGGVVVVGPSELEP